MPTGIYQHKKGYKRTKEFIKKVSGKNHWNWKGTKVGYIALHQRIQKKFGKANKCENQECSKTSNKFEWANKNHKYSENQKDWKQLCKPCHARFDRKTPEFCNCGKKHYAKKLCRKCYQKKWIKKYRQKHK